MKHLAALLPTALVVLGGLASPARATVLYGIGLDGLCDRSTVIARGEVISLAPAWQGGRIVTAVTLRVERSLAGGAARGSLVTFYRLGGEVGGIGQRVIGEPSFQRGEEVLVFLQRRFGRLFVTGMVQGKMRVLPPSAPGGPRRIASALGRFPLRGGGYASVAPKTLGELEARILGRLRATGRALRGGRR